MNEQKKILEYINEEIEIQGMKQKAIAKYIGMGEASLSKCLNGKQELTIQNLIDICAYLNIEFAQMFDHYLINDMYHMEVTFTARCSKEAAVALQAANDNNTAFKVKGIRSINKDKK